MGTEHVNVGTNSLWIPDIVLYNRLAILQILVSLSKRTKYEHEDVLDNFCQSAHYLAHTEFGACLPVIES